MIKLIYKRNKIKLDEDFIKVYSVINKETNKTLGYIENDEDFGWRFFKSIDHDWYGGLETLKETKEWLEGFNGGKQIITKLINK